MIKALASSVFIVVVGVAGYVGYFLLGMHLSVTRLDAVPRSPTNYKPAALELIKLCQSDPTFYSEDAVAYLCPFNPIYAPPSVAKLVPEVIRIDSDHAVVTWGGGFYHCGWDLVRGPASADGLSYAWTLSFTSEDHPSTVLETVSVKTDQRLSESDYVNQVLAEIDRRLASGPEHMVTSEQGWYLAAARCVFLEKHHRVDLLPAQVRKSATYPYDWRDVLLRHLIDHHDGVAAADGALRNWANATAGPAAWIYAAYTFYQAGETAAGDDAVKKAIATRTADPEWIDNDIPEFELGMAVRLYRSNKFSECASLCLGISSSQHRYFKTQSSVQLVQRLASASATTPPSALPEFDKYTALDPFGGFKLDLLLAAEPAATSRPN